MICDEPEFTLLNQTLILLCRKAIFWKQEKTLIIADVHLGKGGHFRKAGIALPTELAQDDLAVLSDLIREFNPTKLIFLGDLFHSDMNNDWGWFVLWRDQFPQLSIILVRGNHDVIDGRHYLDLNIQLCLQFQLGPFLMLHEPMPVAQLATAGSYILCGHIHPGVHLKGKGRQSVTLPCFAFGTKQGILPSFGKFTGRIGIQNTSDYRIFGVLKNKVIQL